MSGLQWFALGFGAGYFSCFVVVLVIWPIPSGRAGGRDDQETPE